MIMKQQVLNQYIYMADWKKGNICAKGHKSMENSYCSLDIIYNMIKYCS